LPFAASGLITQPKAAVFSMYDSSVKAGRPRPLLRMVGMSDRQDTKTLPFCRERFRQQEARKFYPLDLVFEDQKFNIKFLGLALGIFETRQGRPSKPG
jgi:hypothetical protein